MKRMALAIVGAIVVFLAGYWPQHSQLTAARAEVQQLGARLATAESRVRLGDLLGRLLRTSDAVSAKNYGEAAGLSSAFFDAVRQETTATPANDAASVLRTLLQTRDRVTTMIAATDPGLPGLLKDHERSLRRALGYPIGDSSP